MRTCALVAVTMSKFMSDDQYIYSSAVLIGFNPTTYSVGEDVGSVTVAVSLLSGILARDVIVSLQTMNSTAVGKSPDKLSYLSSSEYAIIL